MKLQRTLTGWAECSPKAMSQMSPAAIQYALEDARADILTMAALLCQVGYPRRGTAEETQTLIDFARKVQALIPHEEAVNLPKSHEGRVAELRAEVVARDAQRETDFAGIDEAIATHRAAKL